jgi:hypothetical protein
MPVPSVRPGEGASASARVVQALVDDDVAGVVGCSLSVDGMWRKPV